MKKWQEERNYRRIYNEAGEAIANNETQSTGQHDEAGLPWG